VPFRSYRSILFKFWTFCIFEPPFGVETTYDVHLGLVRYNLCYRPSICRLSVCLSSVTFVHPTKASEIFGNVSTPCCTLAINDLCVKILRRSSQGNPFVGGLNPRGVAKYSDFGPFEGYILEMMQDMI